MNLVEIIKAFLRDVRIFSKVVVRRELRPYQLEAAKAIIDSVINKRGLTFAVVMSRQAGKNELSAQLEAYLMNLFQRVPQSSIVKASPTYKPQTVNSKMRLRDCLDNEWNRPFLRGAEGYITRLGRCRCFFFSAHPSSNVVGATASVLLECDEAQDVDSDKWNKEFAPMAAATNATTVFYGTVWTSRTLLAQVIRELREAEKKDGIRRVFMVPWDEVAKVVPSYGEYVRKEMARLGEAHPIVKTQYKLEEISDAGLMFPPSRVARMRGRHDRLHEPVAGGIYALTVDLAGEDEKLEGEELRDAQPRKDSTVVTVFRVDLSSLEDPLVGFPRYEVVNRYWWTGRSHKDLYATLCDLVEVWRAAWVVVDASGVGAGVSSFLVQKFGSWKDDPPGLIVPVVFSMAKKSDLGWGVIAAIERGGLKVYVDDHAEDTRQFWREVAECEFEVLPGAGQRMRWGVADPAVHDDMIVSLALVSMLDEVEWSVEVDSQVIEGADHLAAVDRGRF